MYGEHLRGAALVAGAACGLVYFTLWAGLAGAVGAGEYFPPPLAAAAAVGVAVCAVTALATGVLGVSLLSGGGGR